MATELNRRTVIDANSRIPLFNFSALWEYRELLVFMIWREWSVRYKQTALGLGWVILQPIVTTIIFSVVFGLFARIPTAVPYPLFFLTGFVPYRAFAEALGGASGSLTNNASLVNKVYFPRLILPLASVITTLSDFLVAFGVLLATVLLYGMNPFSARLIALPLFLGLAILTATAISLWLSAMNVKYRDVAQLLPFIVQVWLYGSPVIYPVSTVEESLSRPLEILYSLNPLVSVVEGFRWMLLDASPPDYRLMAISTVGVLVLLVGGLIYFNRMEQSFGDII